MNGLDLINTYNPFLKPLGTYINLADWPDKLAVDPLAGVNCARLDEMQRDMLLAMIRRRFEPTTDAIQIGSTLQTMIWQRYVHANPTIPQNRGRTMVILGQRGRTLGDALWLPTFADAFMIMGCTGTGKSKAIERYLESLCSSWDHTKEEGAEWHGHLQVPYLIVSMQVHIGALLYAILAAIDATIGTSYHIQYNDPRKWTVAKLAIEVGILLVQHSVGLLVIEEVQPRNFSASPNREEMLLFILRLLNFGIPVALVGNPLGFVGLEDFSQDMNRLTSREPMHLMPLDSDDSDWVTGMGPGMWAHNVMPQPTPWDDQIRSQLFECSASLPGYTAKAVEGTQRIAFKEPGRVAVTVNHLKLYREQSEMFKENRDLIDGFRLKDPFKLMRYLDVPWEEYGLKWGKISAEDINSAAGGGDETISADMIEEDKAAYRSVHQRLRMAAAAKLTRGANKKKASRAARAAAGPADLRSGTTEPLAAGLDALRKTLEKEKTGGSGPASNGI